MSEETIAAILTALLPLTLTALITWLERRGQEARRTTAIDTAYKRIQFLQLYLTTQQLILASEPYETLKQTIGIEIERIFLELTSVLNDIERTTQHTKEKNAIQRILLLYPIHTPRAKLFRGLFYTLLTISTVLSLLFTIGTSTNQDTNLIIATIGISIILLPFVALALLFRWLAIRQEGKIPAATKTVA
jgi:hypothetical protein